SSDLAIESILRSSSDIMKESQRMPFFKRELVLSTYHEHRQILDALKTRDSAMAGKAIETHITNAAQRAGVFFPVPKAYPRPREKRGPPNHTHIKKPLLGAAF